ncbi:MAG: glycoside hydrolase family 97 protein [Bacteroidaceae bacterium]|nr:glycoside hydrolase family 97 protein [Bacteroidaceae bacterium]
MRRFSKLLLSTIMLISSLQVGAKPYKVTSPNGRIIATLSLDKTCQLSILLDGEELMAASTIDLTLADGKQAYSQAKVARSKRSSINEVIEAPMYRQASFTFKANQLDLKLQNGFGLIVLATDEGVAYRFYQTNKGATTIYNEVADYHFGADRTAWLAYSTNKEKPMAMAFQNIYHETAIGKAEDQVAFLPVTIDCDKAKVTLLETDIVSYPGMFVRTNGNSLKAEFAPYPKKMDYYRWRGMSYVKETEDYIARHEGTHSYPWRILAVTEDDTQMPLNNMVYALARPNKIGSTDWIKPGKVAWDWWNDWNLRGVDFVAGINYDTYKYYIDFAAAHGLEYIILDEGWYDSNKANIMQPIDEVRLPELIEYANEKNVGIVLWTVFNVIDEKLEEACKHYAEMGIKGFKVDFLDRNDQTAIEMVERLAAATARHQLLLDLHGIYAPVGLNRTYPNILNYEGVFGMEEVRWTELKNDMPLYDVTFPFIRMMAGAVDFTPGAMRNGTKEDWAAIYNKPISMGTRCHQAACYIVHDSPFTMLADSPTNYEADEPYTQYIASLPTVFDETRILQGKLGEYIATARRLGDAWYIAGQTNWEGQRELTIDFSFLTEGKSYQAHLLTDGVNAHHDAEDYRISTIKCNASTKQTIHMMPGGGFVIKLKIEN